MICNVSVLLVSICWTMHPLCTHVLLSSMAHSICAVPSKNGARSITQNKFERTMITYTISLVCAGFCLFFLLFLWGGRKLWNVTDLVSLLTVVAEQL